MLTIYYNSGFIEDIMCTIDEVFGYLEDVEVSSPYYGGIKITGFTYEQ